MTSALTSSDAPYLAREVSVQELAAGSTKDRKVQFSQMPLSMSVSVSAVGHSVFRNCLCKAAGVNQARMLHTSS